MLQLPASQERRRIFADTEMKRTLHAAKEEKQYELHRLLAALFSLDVTEEERNHIVMEEYHISEADNVEEELNIMCNLSQGVKERGIEEGRETAHAEIVINMYKSGLTAEQIAELAALSFCKVQRIIEEYTL